MTVRYYDELKGFFVTGTVVAVNKERQEYRVDIGTGVQHTVKIADCVVVD